MTGAMLWIALMGCAAKRIEALETQVAALQAQQAEMQAEIARLNAELDETLAPWEAIALELEQMQQTLERQAAALAPAEAGPPEPAALTAADWASLGGESLASHARFLRHRGPDGGYDGYRVSAIRRGSLLERAGLKNGDVLNALRPVGQEAWIELGPGPPSPDAQAALRGASAVEVRLTRRGQPLTLTITRAE